MPDERFWSSTPFCVAMELQETARALHEAALLTGWFAERFAREQMLQSPQSYITDMLDNDTSVEAQTAMAEAELTRMAMAWGLELEEIEPDD